MLIRVRSYLCYLLQLLRKAGPLLFAVVEIPFRYLFGRDLFITYSRRDSRKYAPNLALALQKRMPKLSVYLDRWIAPPLGTLPLSLRLQLRWSSMLVVVCTENAVNSPFVQAEVARFARLRRKVVTIDVDGAYGTVRGQQPWVEVSGADPEEESGAAVQRGEPSENVIGRILKSVEFTMQDRRLRRAVWGTLAFVALSVGGTSL
jgi:TIR domain